jgi:hypothetical protein
MQPDGLPLALRAIIYKLRQKIVIILVMYHSVSE